ncbi:hypothetical protein TSAR_007086 [Trichomalopsis sarcophagae]|uniref:Uncharacterized protein n=1 Tax=Trichomalopsis sarcophagae TaxID=543379 RepID=A0A232ERY2_9HYME|nr:hypothetical protein TSAR_007086 [Trichomalopsis sarcophagae]
MYNGISGLELPREEETLHCGSIFLATEGSKSSEEIENLCKNSKVTRLFLQKYKNASLPRSGTYITPQSSQQRWERSTTNIT